MNLVFTNKKSTNSTIYSTDLLEELSRTQFDGCLQVFNSSIFHLIYFDQGKLIYATNSLEPFERLERHLRRLSHEVTTITKEIIKRVSINFETDLKTKAPSSQPSDYQAICWLIQQKYLKPREAAKLIIKLMQEVFETYFLFPEIEQKFLIHNSDRIPVLCRIKVRTLVEQCRKRLQKWKTLSPQIWSSYQRPYFFASSQANNKIAGLKINKLRLVLKGFNWRQLSAILNQDELKLATRLHPLIIDDFIVLKEPQKPFNILPKITDLQFKPNSKTQDKSLFNSNIQFDIEDISKITLSKEIYQIICVDDNEIILKQIKQVLEHDKLLTLTINDSLKALKNIFNIRPDLILLDINMPNINGCQLCSLIRKHPLFKTTPIIMLTSNESFLERVKAKLVGATDYMKKPFNKSELLNLVFRYLT